MAGFGEVPERAAPFAGVEYEFFRHIADDAKSAIHFVAADHGVDPFTDSRSGARRYDLNAPRFGRARASIPLASLFKPPATAAAGYFEDALNSSKRPSNLRRCPENYASKSPGIFEDARSGLLAFAAVGPSNRGASPPALSPRERQLTSPRTLQRAIGRGF
jgi:hypothetical protein